MAPHNFVSLRSLISCGGERRDGDSSGSGGGQQAQQAQPQQQQPPRQGSGTQDSSRQPSEAGSRSGTRRTLAAAAQPEFPLFSLQQRQ